MTSEWASVRVRDLGRVITGRTPPASQADSWGEETPFLTPSDFDGQRTVEKYGRRLSAVGRARMARVIVPHGVAVSCIGWQMGRTVLIREPTATNQQINTIVYDPMKVDGLFLYYNMVSRRDAIFNLGSSGSRTPIVNKSLFEELEVDLPPLLEQLQISAVLGSMDEKIEANKRMALSLHALATALFRSWFVDFDPVVVKASGGQPAGMTDELRNLFPSAFDEGGDRQIPQGWADGSLDTIADYRNGLAMQRFPPGPLGWLPVVKIAELRQGSVAGSERASLDIPRDAIIGDGDVVFSWSGSLLVKIWCGGRAALNQHLFRVTSTRFPKWFYYFWTLEHLTQFQSIADDKRTTMGHIKRHHLADARVAIPPQPVIEAASKFLGPLLDRAVLAEVQNRTLDQLRNALLGPLLSGDLRLGSAHQAAEASHR